MKSAKEKLPLLVNGSLPDHERTAVMSEIENDSELKKEFLYLTNLREKLHQQSQEIPSDLVLAKIKKTIREEPKIHTVKNTTSHWWRTGAIAACTLLAFQSFLLYDENNSLGGDDNNIKLLDGGNNNPNIHVIFKDDATMLQIQQAIQEIEGTIVDGPSAIGLVSIKITDSASTPKAIKQLQTMQFIDDVSEAK